MPRSVRRRPRGPLITGQEAAERLQKSTKTIRRYGANGTLTAYRVGPVSVLYDSAEVDELARPIPATTKKPAVRRRVSGAAA